MVASERAFAAATAEIGVRDGFLTFFAADAVKIVAGTNGATAAAVRAREGLIALPLSKLPLVARLMWEPFTGQVSADGALGWLTGGYANLNQTTNDLVGKGAYFSVWKRQPDGTWRVWLDEGVSLPDLWKDASPFRVAPDPDRGTAGTPSETLAAAEQAVATSFDAWRARLGADVCLHRDGRMPVVSRDLAAAPPEWLSVRYTVIATELAGSGDLGVTLGGYDATPAEHGTWVRVWKRDTAGRWRIVFETTKAAK